MADRRGPSSGYDFGAKRQYRRAIYAAVRRFWCNQMAGRACVIMPSIEGDEIEVAIRAGFHPRRIAIIDKNPAIVATLKRRYPLVTAIGVTAARAARRVVETIGPVDFVNLDLCSPIGKTVNATIDAWTSAGAIKAGAAGDGGLLAITVLRGRGTGAQFRAASDINVIVPSGSATHVRDGTDLIRHGELHDRLNGYHLPSRAEWARGGYGGGAYSDGVYRSTAGSQTMLWTLFSVHARACLCRWCLLSYMGASAPWAPQRRLDYDEALYQKMSALLDAGVSEHTLRVVNRIAEDDEASAARYAEVLRARRRNGDDGWDLELSIATRRWAGAGPRRERKGAANHP